MAYEKECDTVLDCLDTVRAKTTIAYLVEMLHHNNIYYSVQDFHAILNILKHERLIETLDVYIGSAGKVKGTIEITPEGIAFCNNVRFQNRKAKIDKEEEKLNNEIEIGRQTIRYWWLPIGISGLAFLFSIFSWWMPPKDTDAEMLQSQIKDLQTKIELNKHAAVKHADSLYEIAQSTDTSKKK